MFRSNKITSLHPAHSRPERNERFIRRDRRHNGSKLTPEPEAA
jgi:hypothetical protein